MPLTHFPNGLSSEGRQIFQDKDYVTTVTFASASGAETTYAYVPFAGTLTCTYIADTAARVAAYTCKVGSAGTTLVNGVSNTTADAGVTEALTVASAAVAAGTSISVLRGVQGSTGTSKIALTITRTA